ncbi:anaphase promoting complex (APC) subunit 2, partial [Haematococcus lacustris]
LMTLVGNYGALPLERLHEMLRASMVWPRFSKTPAELRSHLDGLVAAGRLAYEAGLY